MSRSPAVGPSSDGGPGRLGPGERAVRVVGVPGVGVRQYLTGAFRAVEGAGATATVLPGPGQPGVPADIEAYAERLAGRLAGQHVDILVGQSFGAQVVAYAAARTGVTVGRVVLVSPTVDPRVRSVPKLLAAWASSGRVESPRLLASQGPEWARAGPRALAAAIRSALRVELERVVPQVRAPVTVVHGERDLVTSHAYAALLAQCAGVPLTVVPSATHSWPYGDGGRFAGLLAGLT